MGQFDRLPSRFPDGTRYIVEGRDGCILRYLEYPDGRHVDLPAGSAAPPKRRRCAKKAAGNSRK
jgi:hypothetical protein